MLGLETAEYLAAHGNAVTVLKRYETLGRDIEPLYRTYLLRELQKYRVAIVTGVQVEAIRGDGVLVGEKAAGARVVPADCVVLARGAAPSDELAREIADLDPVVIGDASEPRKIITTGTPRPGCSSVRVRGFPLGGQVPERGPAPAHTLRTRGGPFSGPPHYRVSLDRRPGSRRSSRQSSHADSLCPAPGISPCSRSAAGCRRCHTSVDLDVECLDRTRWVADRSRWRPEELGAGGAALG
jgi:hypothetical protein